VNIDSKALYEDIIKDKRNFSPENFSNLCEEISKIPKDTLRNALFQKIMDKASDEFRQNREISDQRVKNYQSRYDNQNPGNKETSLITIYYYL
jgi:acid phosphatase class B